MDLKSNIIHQIKMVLHIVLTLVVGKKYNYILEAFLIDSTTNRYRYVVILVLQCDSDETVFEAQSVVDTWDFSIEENKYCH